MSGHFRRHGIGYATIAAGVVNVLIEKLETAGPHTAREWALLLLAAAAAFFSGIIAYRAPFGQPPAPPSIAPQFVTLNPIAPPAPLEPAAAPLVP